MVSAIYSPCVKELYLADGRCLPVPEPVVRRGEAEDDIQKALKDWAQRSGFIAADGELGVIDEA